MNKTVSSSHIGANAPTLQSNSGMMLWAVALSSMLVGARVLAIFTGHSREFWLLWGAIVGLIAFISPLSGVALSVSNVFVSLEDSSPFGYSVGQIAGGGAAARLFLQFATRKVELRRIWRPNHFALAGIMFIVLLSVLVSPFPSMPWAPFRKLLLIVLLYLLTLTYVNTFDKVLFLQFTVVLCAGFAAAFTINESRSISMPYARATGIVGNPNYQAIYLAVALPLVIGLVMYLKSVRWRMLAIGAGISIVGGVIVTASRGGLLVIGIVFVLASMIWGKQQRRVQWLLGALLLVLVIGLTRSDFGEYTLLRFNNSLSSLREGTAIQTQSRVQLVNDSLEVWRRNPLLGVGAGNWLRGVNQLEMRATNVSSAHVWPIQILAEMGVFGFCCYVAFVLLCAQDYRKAIHCLDQQLSPYASLIRGSFAAALGMTLAWTSGNPYNQLWFELLMLGGIGIHILSRQDRQSCCE